MIIAVHAVVYMKVEDTDSPENAGQLYCAELAWMTRHYERVDVLDAEMTSAVKLSREEIAQKDLGDLL